MNGVTGRMGSNQHLMRSIVAIRNEGGLKLTSGEALLPDVILVGRNEEKLQRLTHLTGINKYSTNLDACLEDPKYQVYFDTQSTNQRYAAVKKALRARKDVYCEKPSASNFVEALDLYKEACEAQVKNGVVQDKLWLPGILKLKHLIKSGFFGKILSVRGEFGYWAFDGKLQSCQRPSWNYRKEDGGGIILDMFAHWRYLIDNLFGEIKAITVLGATHCTERVDEQGKNYNCTAEDAAYATFELQNGIICHINSSWSVRVRRDDLLILQVDGTKGSALAGLRKCWIQSDVMTPKPVWNPDIENPINFFDNWQEIPDTINYPNAFRIQWEYFLKHVVNNEPFPWDLLQGAKGVQLAEVAHQSWQQRCWIEVPTLEV